MDVLNQREKLARINKLPENDEEKEFFISLLKDTYGVIDGFQTLFESYLSQTRSRSSALTVPKIGRDYFKRVVGEDVGRTLFSDSMLYYVSLNEERGAVPTIRIFDLLVAASSVIGGALAAGHPSRGGLDIGIAARFPRVGIYGPGLYKAYALESEVAQHPRIVVGSELFGYLKSSAQDPEATRESTLRRLYAQKCLDLTYVDTDGTHALDYAGKAIRDLYPDWRDVISKAAEFAHREWERFKKEGNHKLASRYFCLQSYLIDRLRAYWN
jgi:hypothetical protein